MKPSVRDVVAKALFGHFKFKNWDDPENKEWRLQFRREATIAINAYNKAVRATYTQKITKLPAKGRK